MSDETVYYVTEEMAMAPGIVKEWPKLIYHPTDRNGRLKRMLVSPETQRKEDAELTLAVLWKVNPSRYAMGLDREISDLIAYWEEVK